MAQRVQPDLRHHQRPVAGDVVQPRDVRLQVRRRLEVKIEAGEVQKRQVEVFRRRVVDVRDQRPPVTGFDGVVQASQETLDATVAVPPHYRGGYLVADRVSEDRGVSRTRIHTL